MQQCMETDWIGLKTERTLDHTLDTAQGKVVGRNSNTALYHASRAVLNYDDVAGDTCALL